MNISSKFRINLSCVRFPTSIHRELSNSAEAHKTNKDLKPNVRRNPMDIQMIDSSLRRKLFGEVNDTVNDVGNDNVTCRRCAEHLKKHGLWGRPATPLPDVVGLRLPKLQGDNLDEHFRRLAIEQSDAYRILVQSLASATIPLPPTSWKFESDWTKYNSDGSTEAVPYPSDEAIVFDVEVLVQEGEAPTLATAVSEKSWYSWCCKRLVDDRLQKSFVSKQLNTDELIPLETDSSGFNKDEAQKRIVVGHNVSYDRARIKEQYFVQGTKMRLLDTMSLHIACSGLTGLQRALLISEETGSKNKKVKEANAKARGPPIKQWMSVGSLNNLADVHELYWKTGDRINKDERSIFVTGTIENVRCDFQKLMSYCARDVKATHEVLQSLLPIYFKRFPHPVTFAGMLEMNSAYLPVNQNWDRYLSNAKSAYNDLEKQLKLHLTRLAKEACELQHDEKYRHDPWLWNLKWKLMKPRSKRKPTTEEELQPITKSISYYPSWYRDLVPINDINFEPSLISAQMQITPKLLRMTWDGYPLYYSKKYGWGYIIPGKPFDKNSVVPGFEKFPLEAVKMVCNDLTPITNAADLNDQLDSIWQRVMDGVADPEEESRLWASVKGDRNHSDKIKNRLGKTSPTGAKNHHGIGPFDDENVPGCWFYKLPHKDGALNRVGNPLAKNYLNKIEDGTLRSSAGEKADYSLKLSKMISYWRNAHKRIESQMVVWLNDDELPSEVQNSETFSMKGRYGAILPKIIVAGTVTRRAVEPTWLTASNAYVDRVGSELKAMVQAFPGYHFVGADVDSQELWIAAILGDAHFGKMHGCTAFGWMTLQGKKADGTDMHSRTASTVGITRDQAKVMNYGRIYGAGQTFASRLLMQFNHRLTDDEAKERSKTMYASTKGVRGYVLNTVGRKLIGSQYDVSDDIDVETEADTKTEKTVSNEAITMRKKDLMGLLRYSSGELNIENVSNKTVWMGGTESAMFNKLEEIALSLKPETPVLNCRISRALEPANVLDNFMTSRVNWVVQSSAVDYLHLMLVSMRWLFDTYDIDGRFSISIHDEVRYHVKSDDRFRAALALQITNLLTRALFAFKLKMNDLPQSVAFFSAVDIDTVLRKEVNDDCKTPSNASGLQSGYDIPPGVAMDIHEIIAETNGELTKPH